MATTYKVLGQLNPAATTLTTAYTAAAAAILSTISVCNQGNTPTTFRIAVRVAAAAIDPKHYIAYDTVVQAKDTIYLTLGATLASSDIVSVYAGTANLSFNLFGAEVV